jgi:hypothetical protein
MRVVLIIALLSAGLIAAAQAQVWIMSPSGGGGISRKTTPIVLTNLRITNTGAFRTTNTAANRAVFP